MSQTGDEEACEQELKEDEQPDDDMLITDSNPTNKPEDDAKNQRNTENDNSTKTNATRPSSSASTSDKHRSTSGQFTSQRITYPSKDGTYLSQFYNQPLVTTLSSFSHVANLVRNPYEVINNVEELVKQARGNQNKASTSNNDNKHHQKPRYSEDMSTLVNQNLRQSTPVGSPVAQEMDTFVRYHDQSLASTSTHLMPENSQDPRTTDERDTRDVIPNAIPIPALPPLECTLKRGRSEPMTIEEYEKLRETISDDELYQRIFYGSFACNELRAALWPCLLGLVKHRGRFQEITSTEGQKAHIFIDHEENAVTWAELERLYNVYRNQWKAILPDQEVRFTTFRDRKSLIERDVIRCDRSHRFYANDNPNLYKLNEVLMTYMMYDFDIGYVQGMSDLAGPILYVYYGDVIKTFWVFVEVMKLIRRNFEYTQKTVQFQLRCLSELVKATDPIFYQYLREHDSSNCFFAFRAIVCLFKRELMKEDETNYDNVLHLWDSIWIVHKVKSLTKDRANKESSPTEKNEGPVNEQTVTSHVESMDFSPNSKSRLPTQAEANVYALTVDINQADSGRYYLTDTEIFVLSLCLSMIRCERDLVLAHQLDATDIHLHFIDPKLTQNINGFMEHATNIYFYLKNDFDLNDLMVEKRNQQGNQNVNQNSDNEAPQSPNDSTEGFDLLNDYLIINAASGT